MASADLQAALAAHRFGLGEPSLAPLASDPLGWLLAQIAPASAQRGSGLATGMEGTRRYAQFVAQQAAARSVPAGSLPASAAMTASDQRTAEQQFGEQFRSIVQSDLRARLSTAALSDRPFNERLALFWANHFTVSGAKASARGIAGAFEREAIRPHIAGRFETLLKAAVQHAGMLRYLDNDSSAGPDSPLVLRQARRARPEGTAPPRITGLNENLAREVLELHTLGVSGGGAGFGGWGGYTQRDVSAFASVLTGWRVPLARTVNAADDGDATRFEPTWHQPGPKTVLGKSYAEGPQALAEVLSDLARHPSTARFLAFKLARHFVADDPPPALVARLEASYRSSDGDLAALYRTLLHSPEAWAAPAAKLKTPEEFVISTVRVLGLGEEAFARQPDAGIGILGQRVQAAPSPAGWPDRAEDWLGPDAVWKRVEWATRVAARAGRAQDARALARASLGPLLHDDSARQIERAADGAQAMALLLMSPEFQRR